MELAQGIIIPVLSDYVLSPDVYYTENLTGIYFETEDEQFGRITFNNLDAIKICRGEILPYEDHWTAGQEVPWVYKIENSKWLKERFEYENAVYGTSYEFGGNVNEMLTDFQHYVFKFHDQFVEAIARGFWFEKDTTSLFNRELQEGHPFLPLPETRVTLLEAYGIKYKALFNPEENEKLIQNTSYCPQKIIEFLFEFDGEFSINQTLILMRREGKLISVLQPLFGRPAFEKTGLATLEDVQLWVEKEIGEIAKRRSRFYMKK